MKKLTLTAALLAALTLTACGNKTTEATPTPTPDLNSLTGQSFVVNGVTLTVDAAGNLVDAAGNIVYPAGSWTVGQ